MTACRCAQKLRDEAARLYEAADKAAATVRLRMHEAELRKCAVAMGLAAGWLSRETPTEQGIPTPSDGRIEGRRKAPSACDAGASLTLESELAEEG